MNIDGTQHYLWRAVDQDDEIVDVFLQRRRDGKVAKRFFKGLLKTHRNEPRKIVTDKCGRDATHINHVVHMLQTNIREDQALSLSSISA